jgi:uncharacterized protein (TIRG00374 family)
VEIVKRTIQYILPLVIAFFLLKYAYRDFDLESFMVQLAQVKIRWVLLSIGCTLGSHLIRAYRWRLLLQSLRFKLSLSQATIALLIGYVSNLLLPRLGELVRCTVLKKHTGIPTSTSLGTVVGERFLDLVSLLLVFAVTLAIAFQKLQAVLYGSLWTHVDPSALQALRGMALLVLGLIICLLVFLKFKRNSAEYGWLTKLQAFYHSIWQGIGSIKIVENKVTLLLATILMWILYYLGGYVGVLAISETSNLDLAAGLVILVMSSISLTLPVQGGIGAYHLLVSSTIMAYGISKDSAMLYVTIMYSAQLLMTFLAGGISFIFGLFLPSHKN